MKNLKHITILMLCLTFSLISFAQVGIGTENPQATSALDITSTTQGFLIPRMTTAQREAITHSQNAKGLQVYDLNSKSIWISDGVAWIDTKNKFVDGSDPVNAIFVDGNVGIGTISPAEKLEVVGKIVITDSDGEGEHGNIELSSETGTDYRSGSIYFNNFNANTMQLDRTGFIGNTDDTSLVYNTYDSRDHIFYGGNVQVERDLVVSGAFKPRNNAGTTGQILQSSGPDAAPVWTNASSTTGGKFVDGSNSADAVFVAGNVGVGTDSPSEKLDVTGNIRSNELILSGAFKPGSDSGTTGQILQSNGPDAAPVWTSLLQSLFTVFDPGTAGQILQSSGPGAVPVWTNASIIPAVKFVDGSNSADAVFVGGNVGVGTDSPSEKLDVTGNIRSNELILSGAFKPGSDSGTTGQILQSSGPDAAPVWTNASSTSGGKFVDGSVSTDAVFVGGNVGIGTDSPTSKLSVTGTISSTSDMVAGGNFSTGNALRFFTNPQTEAAYIGYTNGSNLYYRTHGGRDHNFTGGNMVLEKDLRVANTAYATQFNATSDERLKKNINSLDSGLEELLRVQTKTYNWKDESKPINLQIGVIAQQLETVFPELVDNSQEYKSVNYIGLIPVMIEAIRDLDTENTELKAMIMSLTKRVNALEK